MVMVCWRAIHISRAIFGLVLVAAVSSSAVAAGGADSQLTAAAREARQVIAVIDWFYVRHRACPQPSHPAELAELEGRVGDGFSAAPQGRFVEFRGISMTGSWLYYTSARYPDRCTLWRKLDQDATVIWRRHNGGRWTFVPGDGSAERPIKLAP